MPDTGVRPLAMALDKFGTPVPWMLEAAIVLELVFNAALELFQESRAQASSMSPPACK